MHSASRPMSDSPLALVRMALKTAREALPVYSSVKSRHDFTQHQLFAMLVLRRSLKTDLRRVIKLLAEWSDLRRELGLKKVPHYSTLCYAEKRLLKKPRSNASWPPSFERLNAGD
jgi:hypothetical protein